MSIIKVVSLFQDVQQRIRKEENGELTYTDFNRLSKLAELRLLYWLTGDVRGGIPPEPYLTQKNKDLLATFITKFPAQLDSLGEFVRPADYYAFETLYSLSVTNLDNGGQGSCDEDNTECGDDDSEEISAISKIPIDLLDSNKFYHRSSSYIQGLRPSYQKPIAKMHGKKFEFLPTTLGAVTLEYVRYPKYAEIKTTIDSVYQEEVPNLTASIDYEWDDNAREILVHIITDFFNTSVREDALRGHNTATGKTLNP